MSTPELFSVAGKTAVFTGATRSLGAAMAIALAEAGADIISIQRSTDNSTTQKAVEALGRKYHIYTCDLTSRPSLSSIIPEITKSHSPDLLINCAGVVFRSSAQEHSLEDYDTTMQINVTASFMLSQAMGNYWLEKNMKGKIVNVSSICGFLGSVNQAPYSMSKGAIELMTKSLSNEWASKGINVNNIAPGYCATDMNADIIATGDDDFTKTAGGRIPAGRWGVAEDFKGPIVFLCSKASDYMHGATLVIDGGHLGN